MPKPVFRSSRKTIPDRTVAARWGALLASDGFTPVANYFLQHYHRLPNPLKPIEAMLVVHLISFKWDEDAPFPGFKTLAQRMGLTPAGVRVHARTLEAKGYLRREMQVGTTNKFHLTPLFRALENLKAGDERKQLGSVSLRTRMLRERATSRSAKSV